MIYLDNAATSFPKPVCVLEAMKKAQQCGANPGRGGHRLSVRSGHIVFRTRERLAEMFGAEPDRVIFTKNCTEALNTAIKGSLKSGAHVIISSLEHNSVLRPLVKLEKEGKISFDIAKVNAQDNDETLENFRKLIRPNTALIVCTHVSNVFGTVLPINRIGQLAHENGALFVVDAAQSAGTFDLKLERDNIDILCMPGHKGLFGPMGTGVLIMRKDITLGSLTEGGTGSFSMEKNQPEFLPDSLESGTLNLSGIAGLCAGLGFIEQHGGESAFLLHENYLTDILISDLKSIKKLTVYDNMHAEERAPVVSFSIAGMHSEAVGDMLDKMNFAVRAGYHCSYLAHSTYQTAESGTVRVSPGFFNNKKDIKNLALCLNKIANDTKIC